MKAVLVKVVHSIQLPGMLSLRSLEGSYVHRPITEAGFKPGEVLAVLPLSELPADIQAEVRLLSKQTIS
jgi:hypothetical protein